jgi:hypothetical protein
MQNMSRLRDSMFTSETVLQMRIVPYYLFYYIVSLDWIYCTHRILISFLRKVHKP